MTKRLRRLFKLLALLKTGWYNIESLQTELKITERQVFRDIETLRSQGYSIESNSETRNYEVHNEVVLPEMQFELDEVLALMTICQAESGNERIPFMQAARRAAMKLQNILPREIQDDLVDVDNVLAIMPEPINPLREFRSVFETLLDSYHSKKAIRIGYKSPVEPEFETTLEPYRLVFCRHSWYVIGHSGLHRERRTFHLGRITRFEETEISYEVPKGFTLKQYFGNAWRMIREPGPDQKVAVRFSKLVARNVSEVLWHPTQKVAWNEDGSIDYTVTVSGLNEISWWILGYGREAKVLKPVKLRKMIQKHASDMLDQYAE